MIFFTGNMNIYHTMNYIHLYIYTYIFIYYNYYYIQLLTLYETFIRFVVCSLSFVLLQDNFKFHFALIVS